MKLVVFAASNSSKSINKQLATYSAGLIDSDSVDVLDLNDFELPLFSEDKEIEIGKPDLAKQFLARLGNADGIIVSFAEHNGSYSAAFKNLFDWCSRINPKVYQGKPMVLLSTSPGPGGAATVLKAAVTSAPYFDGQVKGSFSLPSFHKNFDTQANRIVDSQLVSELRSVVQKLADIKQAG